MNSLINRITVITLTALGMFLLATPVWADDTEIFTGGDSSLSSVLPNVNFIIDTSGSMDDEVTITNEPTPFDPATDYSGSCTTGRIYYKTGSTPPNSCSGLDYIVTSANKCADSITPLSTTGSGYYTGTLAQYREFSSGGMGSIEGGDMIAGKRGTITLALATPSLWLPSNSTNNIMLAMDGGGGDTSTDKWATLDTTSDDVECQADYGDYGDGTDTSKPYPADEDDGGPWVASSSDAINWGSTGGAYTLYNANYLNWRASSTTTRTLTKLELVQEVLTDFFNSTSGLNASLMRFDSDGGNSNAEGGYFLQPMLELDATHRTNLNASVAALTASGNTPLAETLYESALFFRGESVDYGDSSLPGQNHTGVLKAADTTKYESPIDYQCQKNFNVLLTDGVPTADGSADDNIHSQSGWNSLSGSIDTNCAFDDSNDCLDELAYYLYNVDQIDDAALNGIQNISTYTIGFFTDQQLLQDTADNGGGRYLLANSITELTDALNGIVNDVLEINSTFVAPAVSVNAFNRLSHRDDLYFAVFRPSKFPRWNGNIKHYKLGTDASGKMVLKDADGNLAVDPDTGYFASGTRSYWTDVGTTDGDDVELGGAASKLPTAASRTVYTYTSGTAPSDTDLTAAVTTTLHIDNDSAAAGGTLTNAMLGLPNATAGATAAENEAFDTANRLILINWARGLDVDDDNNDGDSTDTRQYMGDPLHTRPTLFTYGGTDAAPDMTMFSTTNEGFLHAINAGTGVEQFAFMPKALLVNLYPLYNNTSATTHQYGLDGDITLWHKDVNNNGVILDSTPALEAGEHLYLYIGMRRGGRNYYALDVTDRSAPELKWRIEGGSGDFEELGQTWSKPTYAKINLHNGTALEERDVLIFGGGYDTTQDTADTPLNDSMGRAIYIVDAETGARLWWAGPTGYAAGSEPDLELATMTNSIPSNINVIDIDNDGFADRLYVGDMGGRVWRFDFYNNTNTGAGNFATGGVLAYLGDTDGVGANDEANNRRFYYQPDVILSKDSGFHLDIAIGSGYRAHPLETANEDRFYVIRDMDVLEPPADGSDADTAPDYPAYTETDLYDATENIIAEGATAADREAAAGLLNAANGWFIKLAKADGTFEGEKVLASSVTLQGQLLFTTFTPVASDQQSCAPSQGTGKVYAISLYDATPLFPLDPTDPDPKARPNREMPLVGGGIPPQIVLLFPGNGEVVPMAGPEVLTPLNLRFENVFRTYWRPL